MSFFNSYFTDTQIYLLLFAGLFLLLAFIMHVKEKNILSVVFLGLTAICIFSFSALLDPFLNLWDERFHALVAKNMMNHPLMPTLYDDPVVDMAYDRWDRYYIWLHKQPLFLWQIMLSFKIFGLSEFSLRIPNIVMGTALVIATYRSGKLIVDRNVGFISSLLTISTVYIMELAAGRQELEHNDFSFLVYLTEHLGFYRILLQQEENLDLSHRTFFRHGDFMQMGCWIACVFRMVCVKTHAKENQVV